MHQLDSEPSIGNKKRFGALLREARSRSVPQLTQDALASRMAVSRALVNLIEQGKRLPTRDFVHRAVRALDLDEPAVAVLWEAAGFVSPTTPTIRLMTKSDAEQALPNSEQNPTLAHLARADVLAILDGWRVVAEADAAIRDGNFEQARSTCVEVVARHNATPTLRLYARRKLAEAQRQLGKLDEASQTLAATAIAADLPETDVTPQAQFVRAQLMAQQGEVELRRGRYEQAQLCFEESKHGYAAVLEGSSNETRSVVHLGLGIAFERLAKVALFLGATDQAEDYCTAASLHLQSATPSQQRDAAQRKVVELRAWALARRGDVVKAIPLHEEARKAAEASGDERGVLKNCIYLGDDWRRRVEQVIDTECRDEHGSFRARHPQEAYAAASRREPINQWVKRAKRYYEEAMQRIEEYPTPNMIGLCMRNLGIIARFEGQFATADAWLERAERHDITLGLQGRLPAIYEARAELYWWQDMRELAARWYTRALDALDELISSSDEPSNQGGDTPQHARERQRILTALEALLPVPQAQATLDRFRPERRWGLASTALVTTVVDAVDRGFGVLISTSDNDFKWIHELADFEGIDGPRVLAQNSLSTGWTAALPRSYAEACRTEEEMAEAMATFERRQTRVKESAGSGYRDLAAEANVIDSLHSREGRSRAQNALELMGQSSGRYTLTLSRYFLPLAFAVKGTRVLAEVPTALFIEARAIAVDASRALRRPELQEAKSMLSGKRLRQDTATGGVRCYRFDNETLAGKLQSIFDQLEEIASKQSDGSGVDTLQRYLTHAELREPQCGM